MESNYQTDIDGKRFFYRLPNLLEILETFKVAFKYTERLHRRTLYQCGILQATVLDSHAPPK